MNHRVKQLLRYIGIDVGPDPRPLGSAKPASLFPRNYSRTYSAAIPNRLTSDWSTAQTSANSELRRSLRALRARSRELARNKGVMKKFLSMLVSNVIGPAGIDLRISFDEHGNSTPERDQELALEIETAFAEWGRPENASTSGKLSWVGQQGFAIRTMGRDGEFLCREITNAPNPFGYALNFRDVAWLDETYNMVLPGDRRVLMSVEVDNDDRPVQYWLTRPASDYLYPEFDPAFRYRTPVPAAEIIHKFLVTEDELQTRGVPWAHAAMEDIHIAGGHVDAELYASRAGACITDYLKPPKGEDESDDNEPIEGFEQGSVRDLESGVAQVLPAGWDITHNDPKHPNTNFAAFQKAVKREIASALEVSYVSLANDLEGVNYSSIRAGLLEERDVWRILQRFMIDHFCHRVFQSWLRSAMLTGAVNLSLRDYERVQDHWRPRGWDWVDPLKDIQADILAVNNGLASRTDILAERGEDFGKIIGKLGAEEALMKKEGINIIPVEQKPTVKKESSQIAAEEEGGQEAQDNSGDGPQRALSIFEDQLLPARRGNGNSRLLGD